MKDDSRKTGLAENGQTEKAPPKLSRRTLLRAGATAMPVVLTLQSGEALARTSNLIGSAVGSRDENGDVLCLDTTYEDILASGKVDIGDDGATVYTLPDTDFYPGAGGGRSGGSITADMACQDGGFYKTHDGGWHAANLPQGGVVVSNVALHSVSARAPVIMRRWTDLG